MDDDQFQGGLSVQGGNPDPNAAAVATNMNYDTSAGEGNADLPPLNFEETTPAVEAEPEHDIDPEMSRRMDEALGGFDMQPIAHAVETPVVDAEPIQQPTDFSSPVEEAPAPMAPAMDMPVEAPVPPVAAPAAPVEEPIAASPETTTMPGYDPAAAFAAPAEQSYVDPTAAPATAAGSTMADYANTPQSAPTQIQPMATAPAKKGVNKILIIALAAVLVVGIIIAVIMMMNPGKKGGSQQSSGPIVTTPDEPEEEEEETKQIGSEMHGYVNVPEDWIGETDGTAVLYKSVDGKTSIRMDSAAISAVTAAAFANGQLTKAQNSGASQPQMTSGATKKVGDFKSYEVNYYIEATKTWNFKYIFEASDNRTHYLWIQSDEPGNDTITSILESFTLIEAPKEETPVDNTSVEDTDDESTDTIPGVE